MCVSGYYNVNAIMKSRNFGPCTWNFSGDPPKLVEIFNSKPIESYAAQIETAPTTGQRHWQFFIRTKNVTPFDRVRGWFPGAHIEIAKHPVDAWNYCCDTSKLGASDTITFGTSPPAGPGTRTDIHTAANLVISEGIRAVHQQMPDVAVRYSHHLQRHACILREHINLPLTIHHCDWKDINGEFGEIRKVKGEWRFDDCLDKKKVFIVGEPTKEDLEYLSRPYNYLMDCKGSAYPRKFSEMYVVPVPKMVEASPSITLPQPRVTSSHNDLPEPLVEMGGINLAWPSKSMYRTQALKKFRKKWNLESSRHMKEWLADLRIKYEKLRCRTPADPADTPAAVARSVAHLMADTVHHTALD